MSKKRSALLEPRLSIALIYKGVLNYYLTIMQDSKNALMVILMILSTASVFARDKAIVIQETTSKAIQPDYEIVSGSEEIVGDPTTGTKMASYASWKAVCNAWKQDLKSLNGNNLISLNCGTANTSAMESGADMYITKSIGTYKTRVRIRDASVQPKSANN